MEQSTGQSFTQAKRMGFKRYIPNRLVKGNKGWPAPNNYFTDPMRNRRNFGQRRTSYTIADRRVDPFKKDVTPAPDRYKPNVAFITKTSGMNSKVTIGN